MIRSHETKADAIDAFMPYAQHDRVMGLLHGMRREPVFRLGEVCMEGGPETLKALSLLLDYHAGAKTEPWKAERALDISIVLLRKALFPITAQPWKVMDEFIHYLGSYRYISDRRFSITEPPTEAVVLGAYVYRRACKREATREHVQWIGDNIDRIMPLRDILKERGDASRGLIDALLDNGSMPVSSGVL